MYKIKTNKSAAKRFKVTSTGKVKFNSAKRRHNLNNRSPKALRQSKSGGCLEQGDAKIVKKYFLKSV